MKTNLIVILFIGFAMSLSAQKVDTTYYDQDWQGVKYKELASYIRYDFVFNDPKYNDKARIFYMDGKLEREGNPLYLDKIDGTKSTWKNKLTCYYPNGNKRTEINFNTNGLLHGSYISYKHDGTLEAEYNYAEGKLQGEAKEFLPGDQDVYYLTFFEKGEPVNNESFLVTSDGRKLAVDYKTKEIKTRKPLPEDCLTFYKDGITYYTYDLNGITLSVCASVSRSYGKFYQCYIQLFNGSRETIEINPDNIFGYYHKDEKSREIEMVSAEKYLAKIERAQAMARAAAGFNAGMNAYNAGYTTSTTTGSAVGTGGYVVGSSTTTTFNPAEKQAVIDRDNAKMQAQFENQQKEKEAIDGGLLKRTMLEPGEQLYKSFYIEFLSADRLQLIIKIGEYDYIFLIKTK